MKIGINLASEPFRRDRPVWVATGAAAIVMVLSLMVFVWIALADRALVANDRAQQARLDRELAQLKRDKVKYDGEMRRPENAEVLGRSVLLNQLLLRKGISWTKIFADLEKTLPANVRITQIRPQVNGNNQVSLEMTVASDAPTPLVLFVQNLEASDVFGSANVTLNQSPSQTDPFYRLRLSVNYAQKL